jgi:Na+/citrate or Na+/malate symporter
VYILSFIEKGGYEGWLKNAKKLRKHDYERSKMILLASVPTFIVIFVTLSIMTWHGKMRADWFGSLISVFMGVVLVVIAQLTPRQK